MKIRNLSLIALASAAALVATAAMASTVSPAAWGQAAGGTPFFTYNTGGSTPGLGLRNFDAASHTIYVPLTVNFPGSKTVTFRAAEDGGSGSVTCQAITVDPATGLTTGTPFKSTANNTTVQSITLDPLNVVAGAALNLNCTMSGSNTSKLYVVDYNP